MTPLRILAILVTVGFALLLIVGFDNVFALLRSRIAIGLAILPLFALFVWCLYRAFRPPQPRLGDREKKSS